jgi:hypothetical protein
MQAGLKPGQTPLSPERGVFFEIMRNPFNYNELGSTADFTDFTD